MGLGVFSSSPMKPQEFSFTMKIHDSN